MKLILEAIKALFRKVWIKFSEMETDVDNKMSTLEAAIEALTPIVVNVTSNDAGEPVFDKTHDEILALLKSGKKVEFYVCGNFINGASGIFVNNIMQVYNESYGIIQCGAIYANNDTISYYSLLLEPNMTGITVGTCARNSGGSVVFFH